MSRQTGKWTTSPILASSPADAAVRERLRLLEERQMKLAVLREALVKGERSGISERNVLDIWSDAKERAIAANKHAAPTKTW